jgi:hypothetical protein
MVCVTAEFGNTGGLLCEFHSEFCGLFAVPVTVVGWASLDYDALSDFFNSPDVGVYSRG